MTRLCLSRSMIRRRLRQNRENETTEPHCTFGRTGTRDGRPRLSHVPDFRDPMLAMSFISGLRTQYRQRNSAAATVDPINLVTHRPKR